MEFEEAHNNLRAIRLLYRLLHDNNLRLRNEYSDDLLIERARGLLKNLLDVAVVSVFQTHLKIIATQEGISKTSFEQEKHMAMLQSKSPVTANNSQISVKAPTLSKIIPQKDEKPQLKFISEKELPSRISDNGGTNSILGEENSMMQHNLVEARDLSNQKGISPDKESSHHEEQHNNVDALDVGEQGKESLQMLEEKVGESNEDKNIPLLSKIDEFQYNPSAARHVDSPDQEGDFSDDLLKAMKRIESRVFALQLCSNLVDSTKNNADHHQTMNEVTNLDSADMQGKDDTAGSQNHRLHTNAVSSKSNDDTPKQIGNPLVSGGELKSQNRTEGLNKVKSFNRSVIGNTHLRSQATEASDHTQDLRVAMNQDNLTRKPSKLSGHANRKNLVRKSPVTWSETDDNQKKRGPEHSYAQKPVRSTDSTIARRQKPPPPHQMVIRPTLLDQRSSEIKVFSHHKREGSVLDKRETHKSGHDEPWKTRVQSQYHEQEESSSNTQSSSSWTSQQDSGNSSSNSEDYSLPNGTEGSTSATMVDAAYEGSSEESNNSYTSKSNDDNPSQRFGSMKSHRYYPKRNAEKKIGGLKRLKNKLGLIFHHHHHHHHHHYDDDDDDDDNSSIQSKRGHNKHSVWNNLQHVFHRKSKHGVLTKRKVDKTRRGGGVARAVVPRGNQVGQFHRLVEGLLRHMRHSRKQKSHKLGGVKGSRYKPHGRHSKKKLHWWQMLQQRRGVKMKNKGRVKVGFISQKSPKKLT